MPLPQFQLYSRVQTQLRQYNAEHRGLASQTRTSHARVERLRWRWPRHRIGPAVAVAELSWAGLPASTRLLPAAAARHGISPWGAAARCRSGGVGVLMPNAQSQRFETDWLRTCQNSELLRCCSVLLGIVCCWSWCCCCLAVSVESNSGCWCLCASPCRRADSQPTVYISLLLYNGLFVTVA